MLHPKYIISLVFLLLAANFCYGQKRSHQKINAIVIYRDGSVFVGKLLNDKKLSMQMVISTGDTINLRLVDIKKIRHIDKDILLFGGVKYHYTNGLFFNLQIGSSLEDVDNQTSQVDFIVGYRFNKKLAAGIGVGNSYNSTFSFGTWIDANAIPVFGYGRYYLPFDIKVRPFVSTKLGWSFPNQDAFNGDHQGGVLFQPEIGVNFASRKKTRFIISIGQQLQNIKGDLLNFDPFGNRIESKFNLWFNRTVLKFGIEWK